VAGLRFEYINSPAIAMDPNTFRVVYIDHRAKCDRVERRGGILLNGMNGKHDTDGEHRGVQQNIQALLSTFSSGMSDMVLLLEQLGF